MKVASVIISNSSREVDRGFDYYIPSELEEFIEKGSNVIVPFGKYNNYIEGYVVDIKGESSFASGKLKKIADISDEDLNIENDLLDLAKYIKNKYLCTLSEALKLMIPPKKAVKQVVFIEYVKANDSLTKKLKEVLEIIEMHKTITFEALKKEASYKIKTGDILSLERIGCIKYTRDFIKKSNKKEISVYSLKSNEEALEFLNFSSSKARKQIELVKFLLDSKQRYFSIPELVDKFSTSNSIVRSLVEKGVLIKSQEEIDRSPITEDYKYGRFSLTADQEYAINTVIENFKYGKRTVLIHGVTGCGKTEIYLNLVEKFISEDYGSIIMVPEIALTPQTVERFKGRFGDKVAILHSRLSDGERYDQFRKIKSGYYKVVVGARSAVFAPVKDLKLIIMDEEHEFSYKSESSPRYLTHDIASFRIKRSGGILILGSATPSIESYYKAKNGEYALIKISKRVKSIPLPEVKLIDMKNELLVGNKSMFSRELYTGIGNNLKSHDQTILFLNRRGHSTFVSCRSCGYVCECESCSVTLTLHQGSRKLKCHHCSRQYDIPSICPKCSSKYIKYFGAGTEKVEKEVEKYFSNAKISRMDVDTTRKKGSYEKIYKEFKNREKDILIGTQMVSKGMDFSDVTLVGVISADISLNIPDFRASEKTFQLLTQVSGRSGRGNKKGKVIIQTYTPSHYALQYAMNHDYDGFYNREIEIRRLLNYPPFSNLMHVLFTCENPSTLEGKVNYIGDKIKENVKNEDIVVIGPSPCHLLKIKDKYRWHMIFKGNVDSIKVKVLDLIQKNMQNKDINFMIDIDPYTLT
ncbi:primosomal protein N' [Clostridium cylindrosporum]|uniref:Replication restart protein PriA n=1 Tax=Clostridium cylindrosporum DSM 605 TaxID=1121307 RepID=A0A0J8DAW1_CLOCY|nr:primosomal protein N' [Clostridium cylindrosporum]KMT21449.1 primosomal protein N [Clostridium cylindrosporum DSM 605]